MPLEKYKYRVDFIRNNYFQLSLKFNRIKDKDILEHLKKKENATEYIRNLIKQDIDKE